MLRVQARSADWQGMGGYTGWGYVKNRWELDPSNPSKTRLGTMKLYHDHGPIEWVAPRSEIPPWCEIIEDSDPVQEGDDEVSVAAPAPGDPGVHDPTGLAEGVTDLGGNWYEIKDGDGNTRKVRGKNSLDAALAEMGLGALVSGG